MHYLVTGGCGFIGSHLSEALLRDGHRVTVIDDLSTGRAENVAALRADAGFRCVVASCADRSLMADLIEDCDAIFHLAAAVGVRLIVESTIRTIETNVGLTEVVLSLASARRKPVLIMSSSEVYGKSAQIPFREDGDLVIGPPDKGRWSYGCSKAIDEFLALAYGREVGLPVVVVRLFNTVGPRQTGRYGMVIPTLVRQGLAGQDLTVHGDGRQSRCFTHVTDVVRALRGLLESGRHFGQVFNVGATRETSIGELAEQVRELTGRRSSVSFVPYQDAYAPGFEDVRRRVTDITKIGAALGWTPVIELPQILADVIADQRRSGDRS